MPELPEVEVVRRGLANWVAGRTVAGVDVLHPRAVRRQPGGGADFAARLTGTTFGAAQRRGKYLWVPLTGRGQGFSMIGHLGMSGQLLVQDPTVPDETHLRVRLRFTDGGRELRFVDQRTFGGLAVEEAEDDDPEGTPVSIAHIARDPLDARFDDAVFVAALRARRTTVKRALLDQTLISGVGNIYADEALWRSRLHYDRPSATLTRPQAALLLANAREVMAAALAVGGTSFDSLYVNVNGESGYFSRDLDAYGRENEPCRRCGTAIRRAAWMNRSSYFCPRCQRVPRVRDGG
ncbi:bifunctional DNA-formamidopyrimidine glycosylase/DNA-(apurinic or apyrimidinic site) lyase [Kitasatospora purpeofusca]|uniref:bifunctional DNA-formamidopyrimidine glycosylase/DNA-(apurinic or apyrimidinic site) lyase n=1 Tax=Kitasatospora purpeofusca TaxID=67352 RepID=UPI002253FE70|nr:bifunctional DNA-formamidopyrimidine glycosylase/DNA-(apurinic or apyrimidinic site) lyase [Kitasatospora purpeofusca]MCX4755055.1 bifunctional DNA-formamidopyrimidine glycosylase/DNA-(apurinic or apyrimidinic site) lyase [Kitasatospora purpeofusca]WSR34426.1 bifunctional DNA-formamidopyrimidine glycosylase/DNA-(apurinic or apyrimidinic site) lyase [Kitasatospora purpeofusca]WSR42652.1 bifunctional DNA-formamidopyrimidine glycosylase/DNA-(apurinic or apyrimidinic site) lyase [Kitasatospora pu